MQPYLTESEPDLGDSLPPSDSHTRNSPSCVGTSLGPNVAVQTVAGSPQGGSSMKLSGYFTFVVLAFGSVLSTSAQQNPTQVTVSSVVTCVSTGDQRQHCSANTSAGVVMLRQSSETNCLLGRNWGYDAQGVWVTEGCGGRIRHRQHIAFCRRPGRSKCIRGARGSEGGDGYRHNRRQSQGAVFRHA